MERVDTFPWPWQTREVLPEIHERDLELEAVPAHDLQYHTNFTWPYERRATPYPHHDFRENQPYAIIDDPLLAGMSLLDYSDGNGYAAVMPSLDDGMDAQESTLIGPQAVWLSALRGGSEFEDVASMKESLVSSTRYSANTLRSSRPSNGDSQSVRSSSRQLVPQITAKETGITVVGVTPLRGVLEENPLEGVHPDVEYTRVLLGNMLPEITHPHIRGVALVTEHGALNFPKNGKSPSIARTIPPRPVRHILHNGYSFTATQTAQEEVSDTTMTIATSDSDSLRDSTTMLAPSMSIRRPRLSRPFPERRRQERRQRNLRIVVSSRVATPTAPEMICASTSLVTSDGLGDGLPLQITWAMDKPPSCFSSSGSSSEVRTRRHFNDAEKAEIAITRKIHACTYCKFRNIKCLTVPGSDKCQKCTEIYHYGAPDSSPNSICVRQNLAVIRSHIPDFFSTNTRNKIDSEIGALSNPFFATSWINVAHPLVFECDELLTFQVQIYGNNLLERLRSRELMVSTRSREDLENTGRRPRRNPSSYTIISSSLPSVATLDHWGRKLLQARCAVYPWNLHHNLDAMLLRYVSSNIPSAMVSLVESALTVISLTACWTTIPIDHQESLNTWMNPKLFEDDKTGTMVSGLALLQLKCVMIRGIERAEPALLKMLDQLRNRKDMRIGRQEWIIVGICLMRLILIYRDFVLYYASSAGIGKVTCRFNSSMLMYDTLVAVYGATFHGTISPFSVDWDVEEYSDILAYDPELMNRMEKLRIAYNLFTADKLQLEDEKFRRLIVEPERRRMEKVKRKMKRQGRF